MIQLRQFTQWNPEATLQDITIRNNTGTGIGGACVSFAGSDVAPVDVIDERNVCR